MNKKIRILHYVPHYDALDWLRCGWIVAKRYGHQPSHDQYVSLMEWLCDCKMVKPQ